MYKKTSIYTELEFLDQFKIVAYNSYSQSKIIVSIQYAPKEIVNIEYYFTDKKEHGNFYRQLKKLIQKKDKGIIL